MFNQTRRFFKVSTSFLWIGQLVAQGKRQGDFSVVGEKINKMVCKLGPTFVKLGQMLSLRTDLIPSALADELRGLLDKGRKVPIKSIERVFKEEFDLTPQEAFEEFNPEPLAVASLAQVHSAKHKGRRVVVKVQKPKIRELIEADLALTKFALLFFPAFSKRSKRTKALLKRIISEFFDWMTHELDYRLEALHLSRVDKNFAENEFVVIPDVFYGFSSKKVLTMEYIEGASLNEIFNNVKNLASQKVIDYKGIKLNKREFLQKTVDVIFKQIFEDGYFHADPHPANLIITKKGQLAYIDFGVVGVLDPRLKQKVLELFEAVVDRDVVGTSESFVNLDEVKGHVDLPVIQKRVRELLNKIKTGSVLEMTAAEVFHKLIDIALECNVELPMSFAILGKTLLAYDGDIRQADPQFDIIEAFKERMEKAGVKGLLRKFTPITVRDLLRQSRGLPQEVVSLLRKLSQEGIEITVRFAPTSGPKLS